jgi:AAA ATPase domain
MEGEEADRRKLKEDLEKQLRENIFSFNAGDFPGLCKRVSETLEKVILSEAVRIESRSALDLEIEAHDTFATDRSKNFVGRKSALDSIDNYLKSDDQRPMVIYGDSGSGKSAIIAKVSATEGVVRRFIGAPSESSNGLTLLRSLCQEISRRYGQPEDIPATFNELVVAFRDRIELATTDRPLNVYIDALDQLEGQGLEATMNWLPSELPRHCKVVVSTIEVPDALKRSRLLQIEPFRVEEADRALNLWLRDAHRTLHPAQREKLLANFRQCPLPLYLKFAFDEARLWRSFDPLEQCGLGEGLAAIIDRLFSRMKEEFNHGPDES